MMQNGCAVSSDLSGTMSHERMKIIMMMKMMMIRMMIMMMKITMTTMMITMMIINDGGMPTSAAPNWDSAAKGSQLPKAY